MRRQPHQQENSFSKQRLRHGRPVSRRTIAPRQQRRIFYRFLLFQTHQQNQPDLLDQRKGHLQVLQLRHQILDFVLLATLTIPHMLRISTAAIAEKRKDPQSGRGREAPRQPREEQRLLHSRRTPQLQRQQPNVKAEMRTTRCRKKWSMQDRMLEEIQEQRRGLQRGSALSLSNLRTEMVGRAGLMRVTS